MRWLALIRAACLAVAIAVAVAILVAIFLFADLSCDLGMPGIQMAGVERCK